MKYLFIVLVASSIFAVASCKTTPPAEITETTTVEETGMIKADIGEGKVVFMRDCTRCHDQKKVEDYTADQWSTILPRMIKKAQLDETQSRQVTAYVDWELVND